METTSTLLKAIAVVLFCVTIAALVGLRLARHLDNKRLLSSPKKRRE